MAGTKKNGAVAKPGQTSPPLSAVGGRKWARQIVDSPEVRKKIEREALRDANIALKLFEHGYGRPPQALDVRTIARPLGGPLTFVAGEKDAVGLEAMEADRFAPDSADDQDAVFAGVDE